MKYAVVTGDTVINLIVANAEQKEELEESLQAELVDAQPYNLQIGDLRVGGNWTRNQNGEQIVLTSEPTYNDLLAQVAELQEKLAELEKTT